MHFPTAFLLAALLFLAFAAPIENDAHSDINSLSTSGPNHAFGMIAARSASPVQLRELNANGGFVWIGKPTATFCPANMKPDCPPGKVTAVYVTVVGGAEMDVEVPGGQALFVSATGALGYTIPHCGVFPPGSFTKSFTHTIGSGGHPGTFAFCYSWLACPDKTSKSVYKVFAQIPGLKGSDVPTGNLADCLGFDALTGPVKGLATWEYV